jgi:hypothetical protein
MQVITAGSILVTAVIILVTVQEGEPSFRHCLLFEVLLVLERIITRKREKPD